MIQANELRINNWVNLDDGTGLSSDYRQIKGTTETGVTCLVKGCKRASLLITNKLIYPIPITEDILLKCGFEDISSYKDFRLSINEDLYIEVSLRKNINAYVSISDIDIINVIYLHQLQNLYFALTGKELEVEL